MDNRVGILPTIATAGHKPTASHDAAAPAAASALPPPFVPGLRGGNAQFEVHRQQQQQQGQQQGQQVVPFWDHATPAAAKRRRSGAPRDGCTMCRLRKVRQETVLLEYACVPAGLSALTPAV